MSNELLEALKTNTTATYIVDVILPNPDRFKSDIEALLALQRQECAEAAWVVNNNHQGCAIDSDLFEVNKESILNAKLF